MLLKLFLFIFEESKKYRGILPNMAAFPRRSFLYGFEVNSHTENMDNSYYKV
jgi:hypothetical protein